MLCIYVFIGYIVVSLLLMWWGIKTAPIVEDFNDD